MTNAHHASGTCLPRLSCTWPASLFLYCTVLPPGYPVSFPHACMTREQFHDHIRTGTAGTAGTTNATSMTDTASVSAQEVLYSQQPCSCEHRHNAEHSTHNQHNQRVCAGRPVLAPLHVAARVGQLATGRPWHALHGRGLCGCAHVPCTGEPSPCCIECMGFGG